MGNYCSSGQNKKDQDNVSEKSNESPSYQLADKLKKNDKGAPLADPEPISDISTTTGTGQNTSPIEQGINTDNQKQQATTATTTKPLQNVHIGNLSSVGDSVTNSPLTLTPPFELPSVACNLPFNLTPLYGRPNTNRRTENDKKIVIYILASDDGNQKEKSILHSICKKLQNKCATKGYELLISNLHCAHNITNNSLIDVMTWIDGPLEAQCGHDLSANCLAEISRHSGTSYLIPILFLGSNLGAPLLPLTIECQDFKTALNMAEIEVIDDKELLEKWYKLDIRAQPPCYRLQNNNTMIKDQPEKCSDELNKLLLIMAKIFSKELRDSYLMTVVEQEINNTVLMSQELLKRCIWIQNGNVPNKISEQSTSLEIEIHRRLNNIHNDLKNQLSDKHIIRNLPNIQMSAEQLAVSFETIISNEIDGIIDEHNSKYNIPLCTFGVDRYLFNELEEVNRYSRILGQNCANFTIMDRIKNYITGSSSTPLVIFGKPGSGKSVLSSKIAQNVHLWIPDCCLALRYIGLTPQSKDLVSILGLLCQQINVLTQNSPAIGPHTVEFYSTIIKYCLETTKHQIIIILDSIDLAYDFDQINWLPEILLDNVKIILTLSSNITDISMCTSTIDNTINGNILLTKLVKRQSMTMNFVHLSSFSQEQWSDVLSFGGVSYGALQLPDSWKNSDDKIPIQAKILWWLAWLGIFNLENTSLTYICDKIFDIMETKIDSNIIKYIFSLLITSKDGLLESEFIALLEKNEHVKESGSDIWMKFCWLMGPLLLHNNNITIMDSVIRNVAEKRYKTDINDRHKNLQNFYLQQPNYFINGKKEKFLNKRKLIELPYHMCKLDGNAFPTSIYLTDLSWIYDKLCATGCVHLLNDIHLSNSTNNHILMLKKYLELNLNALHYDGKQFYSHLCEFIYDDEINKLNDKILIRWQENVKQLTDTFLERLNIDKLIEKGDITYDLITNLPGKGYFVISLSTEREEICVWDASNDRKIRTLTGVPQPSAICPVGDYGVAVLCKREIKVLDLNEGVFKVTLKGVMNQKMPFFGLHDPKHLVCLSRNRMYVNLMNLESGDCVTTFKAGEDRFLNSLLISGDGRILVCGDETQKPFPLLVWHLSQRKLLYDLRIPHHDFITTLSAITHEGSYVCVVAKELHEPTPNFIVVYDLQSGTLFKKWKPSCNTVSLAISQTNACVIAGLEDARILIWDLVTGNCKFTMIGHNAPVNLLKLDPLGRVLLSGDKEGRDMSIRLWDLDTGKLLAVYTPSEKITTCEILPGGKYVVLAIKNNNNLITLKLRGVQFDTTNEDYTDIVYGSKENEGKIFELKEC